MTGVSSNSTNTNPACQDFTVSTGQITGGVSYAGGYAWQQFYGADCNGSGSLYCLQTDHAISPPPLSVPSGAKLAFLIRGLDPSKSVAGADAQCTAAAAAAHYSGTFMAALAADGASVASRFHPTGAAYYRPDGVEIVAHDRDLFTASTFWEAPIDVDSKLTYGVGEVFLGAKALDGAPTDNCGNWTDRTATGKVDVLGGDYGGQQHGFGRTCDGYFSVICLQD